MSPGWNSAPRLRGRAPGREPPASAGTGFGDGRVALRCTITGGNHSLEGCNSLCLPGTGSRAGGVATVASRGRGLPSFAARFPRRAEGGTPPRPSRLAPCRFSPSPSVQVETESSSLIAPPSPLHHSFCRTQQATRKVRMLQVQRAPLAPCSSLLFVLQWCSFVKKAPNLTPKALASLQRFRGACQGLRAGWGFGEVAGGGWFSSTPRSWPRGRREDEEGPAAVSDQGRWNSSRDAPPGQCAQRAL